MKTGVVLPTFRNEPDEAFDVAASAARAGVDGVFAYDHLWPMGNPERPAFAPFPLLARIARRFPSLYVGTLVARIGLVDDETLLSQFDALEAINPGHVIAAIGTGDKLSKHENDAYGIPFDPPDERRAHLAAVAQGLKARGIDVWIGGGARPTVALAEHLGVALNMWGASPDQVRDQATRSTVTWAGTVGQHALDATADEAERARRMLREVEAAGATWGVMGWPVDLDVVGDVSLHPAQ
jgi:alkanesulfonate monooxygenase SsuD/methylene tetrahydromethanopterin reductase-like flavin-dependent oxidoreductase (luciferase family)